MILRSSARSYRSEPKSKIAHRFKIYRLFQVKTVAFSRYPHDFVLFEKNFVRQKTTKNVGLFQFQFQFSRPITRLAQQSLLLCPLGVRIDKRSRQVKQGEISAGGRRLHFFLKIKLQVHLLHFLKKEIQVKKKEIRKQMRFF